MICSVCNLPIEGISGTCFCMPSHGEWHLTCDPHKDDMMQITDNGFCGRCLKEFHDGHKTCPSGLDVPEPDWLDSPEYRAYQIKHRSKKNALLAEIFSQLGFLRSKILDAMNEDGDKPE